MAVSSESFARSRATSASIHGLSASRAATAESDGRTRCGLLSLFLIGVSFIKETLGDFTDDKGGGGSRCGPPLPSCLAGLPKWICFLKSLADALKHLGCAGQDGVEHDIEIPVGKRVLRHPGLPTNKDLGVFWIEHHFDEPEVGRDPKEALNDRDVLRMTRREFKELSNVLNLCYT